MQLEQASASRHHDLAAERFIPVGALRSVVEREVPRTDDILHQAPQLRVLALGLDQIVEAEPARRVQIRVASHPSHDNLAKLLAEQNLDGSLLEHTILKNDILTQLSPVGICDRASPHLQQ